MRLGLDIAKLASTDGIGTYTRGLLRALDQLPPGCPIERIALLDLQAPADRSGLYEQLRTQVGELSPRCESRLSVRGGEAFTGLDVVLSTSWAVPAHWRGPLVFVVYDLTFLSHPECHTVANRLHCLEGCLRARLADATFLAISEATAGAARQAFDLPAERVPVVYPAAAERFRRLDGEETRRRLGDRFGLAPGYVLAVGSLEPRKNLERLVAAHGGLHAGLRKAHPLVVAGGGGWRNRSLETVLGEAEARGDVHRLGQVTGPDLVALYNGAAVFAYPSLAEGFGLPVLEAMRCGTPVLTSNGSSLPEVAGDAALLVEPTDVAALRDGLASLLGDPGRRERAATASLARAATFSWQASAERIAALVAGLVA